MALQLCQQGEPIDPGLLDWLLAQGDFIVQLLSQESHADALAQRKRLLELLSCLTNLQEYLRHHAVSKVSG